jgi:peptidase C39-like protein
MPAGIFATLALAALLPLDVPYLPQTDALCGGAATAMVYRYWGDAHATVKQFAPLVDRRAGGIEAAALEDAIQHRGWTALTFTGSLERLQSHLALQQPIIVLLADRRSTALRASHNRYHYVVVIGMSVDGVVVHDPSRGPSRVITAADFERTWKATNYWSLLVLPPTTGTVADDQLKRSGPGDSQRTGSRGQCDTLLADAIASIQARGLSTADGILEGVRVECPRSAGPIRELAAVRFSERRWRDAETLASRALELDPNDSYAWDVLGSSRFMQDDPVGALRAWNRIGRPRLNAIHIAGVRRARYQLIAGILDLEEGEVVTAEAFERSRRLLDQLPDRESARIAFRPEPDGYATIDVVIHERNARPTSVSEWAGRSLQAGIDREVTVRMPGAGGQGELWSASWRWWEDRPRLAISLAAPRQGPIRGVWRVDGSWEAQTYATGLSKVPPIRESRAHGGLTFEGWLTSRVRYSAGGGVDRWNGTRHDVSIAGSIEHRGFDDRLSIGSEVSQWIPLSGDHGVTSIGVHVRLRRSNPGANWEYNGTAGAERVSDSAPLALWPGAGEGRVRTVLLRAHPLLDGGIIDAGARSVFGRSLVFGSAEAQRRLDRPRLPQFAVAAFADIARSSRSPLSDAALHVDLGTGLRMRVPGAQGALRIDYAHALRDGRSALTMGWSAW